MCLWHVQLLYVGWIPKFSKMAKLLLQVSNFPIGLEAECTLTELNCYLGKASLTRYSRRRSF